MKLTIPINKTPKNNKIIAKYIWEDIDLQLRYKTKILTGENSIKGGYMQYKIPNFYTDGYSCGLLDIHNSELMLNPIKYIYNTDDVQQIYVLCSSSSYKDNQLTPSIINFRELTKEILEITKDEQFWFGVEQEYYLVKTDKQDVLQQILENNQESDTNLNKFYCNNNGYHNETLKILEKHLKKCLDYNVPIYGTNSECGVQQYEYQLEPLNVLECGDYLLLSRFILQEIANEFGYSVKFDPKPFQKLAGSGCHVNISNYKWRTPKNTSQFKEQVDKTMQLIEKQFGFIQLISGKDNHMRLTGEHETQKYEIFNFGYGDRSQSCRISQNIQDQGFGYFEMRTFGANIQPHLVCSVLSLILQTNDQTSYSNNLLETIISKFMEYQKIINNIC